MWVWQSRGLIQSSAIAHLAEFFIVKSTLNYAVQARGLSSFAGHAADPRLSEMFRISCLGLLLELLITLWRALRRRGSIVRAMEHGGRKREKEEKKREEDSVVYRGTRRNSGAERPAWTLEAVSEWTARPRGRTSGIFAPPCLLSAFYKPLSTAAVCIHHSGSQTGFNLDNKWQTARGLAFSFEQWVFFFFLLVMETSFQLKE